MPATLLRLPARGKLSELQAASLEKMSLSPGMLWAQVLDSLSPPPVSLLEGPEQASQQEAWLHPPSLQELRILILPWQRQERQRARPWWGTEAQSQGLRVELGKRLLWACHLSAGECSGLTPEAEGAGPALEGAEKGR